jgi:hypothetical protein
MKRLTTILVLAVLLAACAGAGGSGAEEFRDIAGGGESGAASPATTAAAASEDVPSDEGAIGVDLDVAQDRKVIRQARLELQADDTRKAFDRIVALVEAEGGFVANANVYPVESEEDQPQVTMTLRVPASELNKVMAAIKGAVTKVLSESQDAQDVTAQYVDLEAQLTNLRALEVELRALLTEVREQPDADPDKLLRVFNEISSVRGQIEQIEGQLQYLDDVVDLATLEVGLTPTPAVVPIVEDTWEPVEVARDALRNLVTGLQTIADWGIGFALYGLPMLLLFIGPPLLIGWFVYRRWRRRRPPTAPPTTPLPAES